jgi:diaminopimelate decarboxylase
MIETDELRTIAAEEGTPCFLFDTASLMERVKEMRKIADGKYHLCYSIKANPFLIPLMSQLVDTLEVCSPGELAICESLHVKPEMILYSGVNKTPVDIREAMTYGVGTFTAESLKHMREISEEAVREGKTVPVLPRLNAGSQFGMSEEDLLSIIDHPEKYPNTVVRGIHYFAGTQRKKTSRQLKELELLKNFFHKVETEHGKKLERLEYGPGLCVSMFTKDDFSDTLKPMKDIHEELSSVSEYADLTIEMGRFYSAYCGTYLTRVMDLKSCGNENYCILDGGINHVNYYGSMMGMNVPVIDHMKTTDLQEEKEWTLCGSLCSTNDVLVRQFDAKGLSLNDILAFRNIGSYSMTEGIHLFLSRTMPKIILWKGKGDYTVVRDFTESYPLNTPQLKGVR